MSTNNNTKGRKAQQARIQERVDLMVARIFTYLRDEYIFMKTFNVDNCNLASLNKCKERTSQITNLPFRCVNNALTRLKSRQDKLAVSKQAANKILNDDPKDKHKKPKQTNISKKQKTLKTRNQKYCNITKDNEIEIEINIDSPMNIGSDISDTSIESDDQVNLHNSVNINDEYSVDKSSEKTLKLNNIMKKDESSFNVNNKSLECGFPSTFIKQEECEDLSQEFTVYSDDEDTDNSDQGSEPTETYIIQEVDHSIQPINQEEYEIPLLSSDVSTRGANGNGSALRQSLGQYLQFEVEIGPVPSSEQEEDEILPIPNNLKANMIGVVKIENEDQIENVSFMEEDCDTLELKNAPNEQYNNFYKVLPSSSSNYKSNQSEHIEFVCIKDEVHSDSSDD